MKENWWWYFILRPKERGRLFLLLLLLEEFTSTSAFSLNYPFSLKPTSHFFFLKRKNFSGLMLLLGLGLLCSCLDSVILHLCQKDYCHIASDTMFTHLLLLLILSLNHLLFRAGGGCLPLCKHNLCNSASLKLLRGNRR